MKRDLFLYQRALFLRRKKGYSYGEIRGEVPVAKSTLSDWLSKVEISDEQKQRIQSRAKEFAIKYRFNLSEFNRKKRQKEITSIRVQSKKEIGILTEREFFIVGIMLYWAEGSKGGKDVQISNADPLFIRFIMQWFRTHFIDLLRASRSHQELGTAPIICSGGCSECVSVEVLISFTKSLAGKMG